MPQNAIKEVLTIVDKTQIISAVATSITAIAALITTFQNYFSNKKINQERHVMVKPDFLIRGVYENRQEKEIELAVKNIGYERMRSINVTWKGSSGVDTKIICNFNDKDTDYKIRINYAKSSMPDEDVKGEIILHYYNILGKKYSEKLDILIKNHYDDLTESNNPILQENLVGKMFE